MATVGVNVSGEVQFDVGHALLFGEVVKNVRESQKQGRTQLEHRFTSCRARLADSPDSHRLAALRARHSELSGELAAEKAKLTDAEAVLKQALLAEKGNPAQAEATCKKIRDRIGELQNFIRLLGPEMAPLSAKVAGALANALAAERDTYWATCRLAVADFDQALRVFLTAHAPTLASALAGCEACADNRRREPQSLAAA
jgi:hypothetical protein